MNKNKLHYAIIGVFTILWLSVVIPLLYRALGYGPTIFPKPPMTQLEKTRFIVYTVLLFLSLFIKSVSIIKEQNKSLEPNKKIIPLISVILFSATVTFGYLYQSGSLSITQTILDSPQSYYIKPSSFTDLNSKWSNEWNAYDVNNLTSATCDYNVITWDIYWEGFNNTDKGTISRVDLHVRLDVNCDQINGESDFLTIQWWVGASQGTGTHIIDSSNDGSDLHFAFLDLSEPNDGVWTWSEINDIQIRQVGTKNGPADIVSMSTDEVWGTVTT
jgi:hypothetical protein